MALIAIASHPQHRFKQKDQKHVARDARLTTALQVLAVRRLTALSGTQLPSRTSGEY